MMTNSDRDNEMLEEYLKGKDNLSEQYRSVNSSEPPEHLDRKILAAASEAVSSPHKKQKKIFHKSRWAMPVSIAAVLTLSVSLVVTIQQEAGQPLISEPNIERYDSAVLSEEMVVEEPVTEQHKLILHEEQQGMRQLSTNSASDQAMDAAEARQMQQAEDSLDVVKEEIFDRSVMPESLDAAPARAKIEAKAVKKKELNEAELSLPASVPYELGEISASKRDLSFNQQKQELLSIKSLWEEGNIEKAKQKYAQFIKTYRDLNEEYLIEILGPDIYQALGK